MLNMNRVTLLGHAGRDPEIRTMTSGDRTASFSLATTERWRLQDGRTGEATEWHRIAVFGAAVEAVSARVRKGGALLVEGRIATREYRDKQGENRRVTEIVVAGPQGRINVLTSRRDEDSEEDGGEDGGEGGGEGGGKDGGATLAADTAAGEIEAPAPAAAPEGPAQDGAAQDGAAQDGPMSDDLAPDDPAPDGPSPSRRQP